MPSPAMTDTPLADLNNLLQGPNRVTRAVFPPHYVTHHDLKADFDRRPMRASLNKYIGGALVTMQVYEHPYLAMKLSDEGRWYPIDYGWRSEDGRTLIICDDWQAKGFLKYAEQPAKEQA